MRGWMWCLVVGAWDVYASVSVRVRFTIDIEYDYVYLWFYFIIEQHYGQEICKGNCIKNDKSPGRVCADAYVLFKLGVW